MAASKLGSQGLQSREQWCSPAIPILMLLCSMEKQKRPFPKAGPQAKGQVFQMMDLYQKYPIPNASVSVGS